jgi:hypothetical protein
MDVVWCDGSYVTTIVCKAIDCHIDLYLQHFFVAPDSLSEEPFSRLNSWCAQLLVGDYLILVDTTYGRTVFIGL